MTGLLVLAGLLALARFLPGEGPPGWRWRVDGPLLLASGLALAALAAWLVPYVFVGGGWSASDFGEYCDAVMAAAGSPEAAWSRNRSRLLTALLGLLARGTGGPLAAMAWGSLASVAVLGASLYLWGRSLAGRTAGVAAAVLAGASGELTTLVHTLSFYPEIVAATVLCAATAAAAARFRTPGAFLLAGLGSGLVLLVDLRGLLWAAPAVAVVALVGLAEGLRRRSAIAPVVALLALLLPLDASFFAGRLAYGPDQASLEEMSDVRVQLLQKGIDYAPFRVPVDPHSRFVWGRTRLADLPDTVIHLRNLRRSIPEGIVDPARVREYRATLWRGWGWPLVAAGALAVLGLARRPRLLLALAATLAPFAATAAGAIDLKPWESRFLGTAMPGAALLLGLGAGVLAGSLPRDARSDARARLPWRPVAVGGVLAVHVLGVVPGHFSPLAGWRPPLPAAEREIRRYVEGDGRALRPGCLAGIRDELAGPLPLGLESLREPLPGPRPAPPR